MWGRLTTENQSYGVLPRHLQQKPLVQATLLAGSKDLRVIGTETVDSDGLRGERASDPLTMALWIDGNDHTKRFRFTARHLDLPTLTEDGPLDLPVTFLDIKAPPARGTIPLGEDTADD